MCHIISLFASRERGLQNYYLLVKQCKGQINALYVLPVGFDARTPGEHFTEYTSTKAMNSPIGGLNASNRLWRTYPRLSAIPLVGK